MIKKTKECVIINIAMPEVVRVEKEDKEIEKHRSLCREPRRLWGFDAQWLLQWLESLRSNHCSLFGCFLHGTAQRQPLIED